MGIYVVNRDVGGFKVTVRATGDVGNRNCSRGVV